MEKKRSADLGEIGIERGTKHPEVIDINAIMGYDEPERKGGGLRSINGGRIGGKSRKRRIAC